MSQKSNKRKRAKGKKVNSRRPDHTSLTTRLHKWVMKHEGITILLGVALAAIAIIVPIVMQTSGNSGNVTNVAGDQITNNTYNYGQPNVRPIDPKAPSNYYTLAIDCYNAKDIDGAIEYMQKALKSQIDKNAYEDEMNYDTCVLYFDLGKRRLIHA